MQPSKLVLLFCLSAHLCHAQLMLEHSYPAGTLSRIRLDVSGETYVHQKNAASHNALFTKEHQPIADLPLYYNVSTVFSERLLDDDPQPEAIFSWFEDVCMDGVELWNNDQYTTLAYGSQSVFVDSLPGEPLKLMVGSQVYALPGFSLEHTYPGYAVRRYAFPQQGKFYVAHKTSNSDGFHLFDLNHQFQKSIFSDKSASGSLSENLFNHDAQVEYLATRWAGGTDAYGNRKTVEIASENGQVLFSEPCEYVQTCELPGAGTLMLVFAYLPNGQQGVKVYAAQGMAWLHTFPFWINEVATIAGSEYYFVRYSEKRDTAWLYGADFQLAKTIELPTDLQNPGNSNVIWTKNHFSATGLLECVYTRRANTANTPETICINENGQLLYSFPTAKSARLEQQAGMSDKFFVFYPDKTEVYGFENQSTPAPEAQGMERFVISPNPFQETLQIALPRCGDWQVLLYDLAGRPCRSLRQNACETLGLYTADLPAGTYSLHLRGHGTSLVQRVLKAK